MKLLAFIGQLHKGGAERVMSLLVNEAVARGHQVSLLLGRMIVEYNVDESVRIINLDSEHLTIWGRLRRIRRLLEDEKYDAVISFMSSPGIYACLSAIGTGVPVIVSERNNPEKEVHDRIHVILRGLAYRFAAGAIFQTEEARDYFFKRLRNRSVVIPNPVKDELPDADRTAVRHEIVTLGRLDLQKNHRLLMEAFSRFLPSHSDYQLTIFGRGILEEELIAYAYQLGINEKVSINAPVDNVHEKIRQAAMFVLSSDYEGISNALLECMAMGLPCISTDCPCGGSRMLIENGENGLLVPVGDAAVLSEAMMKIADNEDFANRIGEKAKLVRANFSNHEIMGRYLDYICSVAKSVKE